MDNVYLVAAVWTGLALAASLISIRLGIGVALAAEIGAADEIDVGPLPRPRALAAEVATAEPAEIAD